MGIKDDILKLRRTLRSYKDDDSSFYKVWSEIFINYT